MKSLVFFLLFLISCAHTHIHGVEVRNMTAKLEDDVGGCTAFNVVAPSKKIYVLTALHCKNYIENGMLIDHGSRQKPEIIAEDEKHDLLLLSSNKRSGLRVAKTSIVNEHIRTYGFGLGLPLHESEGELLIPTLEDQNSQVCKGDPKGREYTISTIPVLPGNSGGPIVNDNNEVIGVALALDTRHSHNSRPFSCISSLQSIKEILKNK